MKKPYTLDYTIERDTDRMAHVKNILDTLETDPPANDIEQMATYILYGKDENGVSSLRRGEVYNNSKRYNSYKTSDDYVLSFDELVENPATDEQEFRDAYTRDVYKKKTPTIRRPKFDRKTGELIDPGDSDVPGMVELWERLDHFDKWLHILQGKLPQDENFLVFEDDYRLYRLKHNIIDMKRTQYYLKDAYKPTIHFQKLDHPKAQYYDWDGESAYWISFEEWERRTSHTYTHTISQNIGDYETRELPDGSVEVKWVICKHNFDWENYRHVYALMNNFDRMREFLKDKLDTYGRTLIWDMERYLDMAPLSPIYRAVALKTMQQMPREQICAELLEEFGVAYNPYYVSTLIANNIPKIIARTAARNRLECETPESEKKICKDCGQAFPRHPIFYTKNSGRKDGLSPRCRECERKRRIRRGEQLEYDGRQKDTYLPTMQTSETH